MNRKKQSPKPEKPKPIKLPIIRHPVSVDCMIYDDDEAEFMLAIDNYKRRNKRLFPTCREILLIAKALGYRKVVPSVDLPRFTKGFHTVGDN